MDPIDTVLHKRLAGLESSVPVGERDIAAGVLGIRRTSIAIAAALSLGLFAAGLAVGRGLGPSGPIGHEGLENPGQPFSGTSLHCLAPREASELMTARGFTVVWQLEGRDPTGTGTTVIATSPPDHGVLAGGFAVGRVAHVVVEVYDGATRTSDCG